MSTFTVDENLLQNPVLLDLRSLLPVLYDSIRQERITKLHTGRNVTGRDGKGGMTADGN